VAVPNCALPVQLEVQGSTCAVHARRCGSGSRQIVQRAGHTLPALLEHVRVDHRGGHIGMAQQFLDGADVRAPLQEVRRKLCRKLCALITLVSPARCAATLMALLIAAGST
jgi:hypothetical protein